MGAKAYKAVPMHPVSRSFVLLWIGAKVGCGGGFELHPAIENT